MKKLFLTLLATALANSKTFQKMIINILFETETEQKETTEQDHSDVDVIDKINEFELKRKEMQDKINNLKNE